MWEEKCHTWEKKCHELEVYIEKDKVSDAQDHHQIKKLQERCEYLDHEVKEWHEKYELLDKRCHEWEAKWHTSEETCWKLKEVIAHLRRECNRIREMAHYRIHKLAEKVKHFCRIEKECSCLMEKFEGLCHVEDIMREEIVFNEVRH
jgi:chromosome segregation ATPase